MTPKKPVETKKITKTKVQSKPAKNVANPIALANEGKLQEAANEFHKILKLNQTDKKLYLDFAMTLIELNRLKEAEEALRKAIYLDNKYVMAHFQLGMLMLRANKKEEGLKHLKNSLRIAKNEAPDGEVQGNPGMRYGKLAEILEKEIIIFYE